mgnify:FL=1
MIPNDPQRDALLGHVMVAAASAPRWKLRVVALVLWALREAPWPRSTPRERLNHHPDGVPLGRVDGTSVVPK